MKTILERMNQPTPKFFKILRSVGIALTAVSAAILTSPVSLPVVMVTVAGYVTVAGAIITAVSQTAVHEAEEE